MGNVFKMGKIIFTVKLGSIKVRFKKPNELKRGGEHKDKKKYTRKNKTNTQNENIDT